MLLSDFVYHLPPELIAQQPVHPRDHSRLMVVQRKTGQLAHDYFYNLPKYLSSGDVLIANQSKVVPARLYGKKETGGKVEVLLTRIPHPDRGLHSPICRRGTEGEVSLWHFIGRSIGRAKTIIFEDGLVGRITGDVIKFNKSKTEVLKQGHVPLPPYIKQDDALSRDYQNVYAKEDGSVAAPTAGLHFTPELLQKLNIKYVTLHVGLGTFAPVKTAKIEEHHMHSEYYHFDPHILAEAQRAIAVGTTSVRVLETWANTKKTSGETDIFIYPGYKFKVIDALITNFHLPKSTLLMLVSAFAGRELIMQAYHEAIKHKYRFFSFGDAMLIL